MVRSSDRIAYEDLKIASLVKNRHLAKSISDASWGLFLSWVRYYGALHGIPPVAVSPRYTAQDSSPRGFRVKKTLSMRTHICPFCGLVLDRDWNAAVNILFGCPGNPGSPQPYRRAGGNECCFGSTQRFWTDRPDALCSQGHEALGLDEGRIPAFQRWGVSIFPKHANVQSLEGRSQMGECSQTFSPSLLMLRAKYSLVALKPAHSSG